MKKSFVLVFAISLMFAGWGCAMFQKQETPNTPAPTKGSQGFNQQFYGFPDVPIPSEVSIVNDRSFVYEAPGFKAGVIVFSGNVDPASLENYFKLNMTKNGWRYINGFRYKDIVLNYMKEDRMCNIRVSRGTFQTELEVWVGPADKDFTMKPGPGDAAK